MKKIQIAIAGACLFGVVSSATASSNYLPTGDQVTFGRLEEVARSVGQQSSVSAGGMAGVNSFGFGGQHTEASTRSPGANSKVENKAGADEQEGSSGMLLAGLALVVVLVSKRIAG